MIHHLDHLVLTVADINTTVDFYHTVLGMTPVTFGGGRIALQFGHQKINLHPATNPLKPHAQSPQCGSADLCFIVNGQLDDHIIKIHQHNIAIEEGPIERTGAMGPIRSIYLRDPDGNLLELSEYTNPMPTPSPRAST